MFVSADGSWTTARTAAAQPYAARDIIERNRGAFCLRLYSACPIKNNTNHGQEGYMRIAMPLSRSRLSHVLDRAARALPYLLIAFAMLTYILIVARWF